MTGDLTPRVLLGDYPTPVERLALASTSTELWVKRDDLTAPIYGGNKVRKLEYVLGDARARGKTTLLTAGAVGSHHVLATATYGRLNGFKVEAVLVPQPRTRHAEENLRAELAQGLTAHASREAFAPIALARRARAGSYYVQVGGSSLLGAMGYVDGARELAAQVRAGQMPAPDVVVVTLGTGGTAAGLAAGLALEGLSAGVLGVCVVEPSSLFGTYARHLAKRCLHHATMPGGPPRHPLSIETTARYVGRGYGYPTDAGARATKLAAEMGLVLDPTYTAKAFAAALDMVESRQHRVVLYWHTLSSAPMAPLLGDPPLDQAQVPPELDALFREEA